MDSSTIQSAPDEEISPVYDNNCSSDQENTTDLPELDAPATEKTAVRRVVSDL